MLWTKLTYWAKAWPSCRCQSWWDHAFLSSCVFCGPAWHRLKRGIKAQKLSACVQLESSRKLINKKLIQWLTVVRSLELLCCDLEGQLDLRVVQPQLELHEVGEKNRSVWLKPTVCSDYRTMGRVCHSQCGCGCRGRPSESAGGRWWCQGSRRPPGRSSGHEGGGSGKRLLQHLKTKKRD